MPDYPAPQLAKDILQAKSPDDYHGGLRKALAFFDRLNAEGLQPSGAKLACREGCSLCCSLRVDVYAHEVFLIVHHLRTRFTPAQLAEVVTRLAAHAARVLPLTPFEHATSNNVCALLQDGRCSVYAVRPHSCRRHHSLDFAACQYTYDHPTDLEFPAAHDNELFRTLTEAMRHGSEVYARLGFDSTIYELGTALAEALDTPSSWRRWRDGKKAFLHASVTPAA